MTVQYLIDSFSELNRVELYFRSWISLIIRLLLSVAKHSDQMTITVYTPAHVTTSVLNSRLLRSPPRRTLSTARYHRNFCLTCVLIPETRRESRRLVNIALGVLLQWLALPNGDSLHSSNANLRHCLMQCALLITFVIICSCLKRLLAAIGYHTSEIVIEIGIIYAKMKLQLYSLLSVCLIFLSF